MFKWLRDPRFNAGGEEAISFLLVSVVDDAPPPGPEEGLPDTQIEIALANGRRVIVSGAFDAAAVSRLVRGLVA